MTDCGWEDAPFVYKTNLISTIVDMRTTTLSLSKRL